MTNTQTQLRKLLEEHQSLKRVDKHLLDINKRLTEEKTKLETLLHFLAKKNENIKELEGMSMKGMFHKILGSKEEQIEKERQEYLEASLKFDEAKKSVELIEYEKNLLEEKLAKAPGVEEQLEVLIKKRETELMNNPMSAAQIRGTNQEIDSRIRLGVEIKEALDAGKQCLPLLHQMVGHLQEAKNWGNWDMYSGGRGRGIAEMRKHSSIDRAKNLSYRCQQKLIRFEQELRDIYQQQNFNLSLNMNSFSKFTDIFFDNLISDWIIQKQIKNAINNVAATQDKVNRICESLAADLPHLEKEIEQLELTRKQIIAGA